MELAKRSLVGKARARPDLVKKVMGRLSRDGLLATGKAVFNKLDQPIPLGYSCVGRVLAVGKGVAASRRATGWPAPAPRSRTTPK